MQIKGGAIFGEAPPYEAFCIGGSNSIRGWYDCDLAVAKAFSELTIEYRFPLISIFSGELFMDAGTDFGTQKNVPGKPGLLLGKNGSGVSLGTGVIVTTPVGPIRLEVATSRRIGPTGVVTITPVPKETPDPFLPSKRPGLPGTFF